MDRLPSRRLQSLLELLRPCARLADVGTDHGLLPVAAVREGVAQSAIAADLREAPLAGARAHIERMGVGDRVVALRADGLAGMAERGVDAVVIAGMSADSTLRILDAAAPVLARVEQLVVQPNQNVSALRAWALDEGWHLRDERMLEERGQFFVTCAFARAAGPDPAYALTGWTRQALCHAGPLLLARRDATLLRWSERQRARLAPLVARDAARLKPELELWEAACRALGVDRSDELADVDLVEREDGGVAIGPGDGIGEAG